MCLETTTSYKKCSASFTHTVLCIPHVADDMSTALCPNFKSRTIQYAGGGCECKTDGGRCMFLEKDGERTWGFEEEFDAGNSEREAREYGDMMKGENQGREAREYQLLLSKEAQKMNVEDSAMNGVDLGADEKVQLAEDQCRMRRRAIARVKALRQEDLERQKRERLEETQQQLEDLLEQTKLRAEELEKKKFNLAQLQLQNANENQLTSAKKQLELVELEYKKAIRQQGMGSRGSWTAEQWALEARVCQRLDRGYARVSRWLKWEDTAAKAREQGDPRDINQIIVGLAEAYFFKTKGNRNFYEEKAALKPDLAREPMKYRPKTHEEELGKKKTRKHNPHKPGRALRAQLALEEAERTETTTKNMLDFGPDWGQMEPELEEDEQMETAEQVEPDDVERAKLLKALAAEAKQEFVTTTELRVLARSTWIAGDWAREVERLKQVGLNDPNTRADYRARWQKWQDKANLLQKKGDSRDFNQIIVEISEKFHNMVEVRLLHDEKLSAHPKLAGKPPRKERRRLRKLLKRLERANGVDITKGNMLDLMMDSGSVEDEQREDEGMGGFENEPEKFVVDEEGVIDLTG